MFRYLFFIYVFLLTPSIASGAEKLVLLNWEAYLSKEVIQQWQQESAIVIEQIFFDSDEKRDSILASSQHYNIDLAVVDSVAALAFGQKGILAPLTNDQTIKLNKINSQWSDGCYGYGNPYIWGTVGLAYRKDIFSSPPSSWRVLLEPEEMLRGHIGMLQNYVDTLIPPLKLLGKDPLSGDHAELKQAFELLQKQAPYVLTYDYALTYLQTGKYPEALFLALVYSGDHSVMNEIAGADVWAYTVPNEGSMIWLDCLSVINKSSRKEAAQRFIDFLSRPDIAAMNSESIYSATPNKKAQSLLNADIRNDPSLYPANSVIENSQLYQQIDTKNIMLRHRITSAILESNETR